MAILGIETVEVFAVVVVAVVVVVLPLGSESVFGFRERDPSVVDGLVLGLVQ